MKEMRWKAAAVGVVAVLALGYAVRPSSVKSQATSQTEAKHVEVVAKKFSFEPSELTLKKGEPVVLVLKSDDVAHGLRFRELNVDVRVAKGGTSQVEFTPEKTGDFVGHCSVFCGSGHGSMVLTLHVVN